MSFYFLAKWAVVEVKVLKVLETASQAVIDSNLAREAHVEAI
ncbi:hypothetical protein [Peribacillus butanolivorans]